MALTSFMDLRLWREGMDLAVSVYHGTAAFPKSEMYGLTQQMRRAVYEDRRRTYV